jgi:hypothetical protein
MHRQVREHLEEVLTEPGSGAPTQRAQGPSGRLAQGAQSAGSIDTVGRHLAECRECGDEVRAMREQAALLRQLRASSKGSEQDLEPRPGFYARVMERIEAEGPGSIWSLFFESAFGRRLAAASLALAVLLAVCLITAERFSGPESEVAFDVTEQAPQLLPELRGQVVMGEDQPGVVINGAPDQDSVLVNLVTYREQ